MLRQELRRNDNLLVGESSRRCADCVFEKKKEIRFNIDRYKLLCTHVQNVCCNYGQPFGSWRTINHKPSRVKSA